MKLTVQFERDDLQAMLQDFFTKAGWQATNMDELLEAFATTFPEGLLVKVQKAEPEEAVDAAQDTEAEDQVNPFADVAEPPEETAEPVLSLTDMLDPEHHKDDAPAIIDLINAGDEFSKT